jgi:hypothetical protein
MKSPLQLRFGMCGTYSTDKGEHDSDLKALASRTVA